MEIIKSSKDIGSAVNLATVEKNHCSEGVLSIKSEVEDTDEQELVINESRWSKGFQSSDPLSFSENSPTNVIREEIYIKSELVETGEYKERDIKDTSDVRTTYPMTDVQNDGTDAESGLIDYIKTEPEVIIHEGSDTGDEAHDSIIPVGELHGQSHNESILSSASDETLPVNSTANYQQSNSNDKLYKCKLCNETFTYSSQLVLHKRKHISDKAFKCDKCNKSFPQKSSLIKHKRVHSDKKPYKCEICHKAFSESSYLAGHRRTHTTEKVFQCDQCDKSYTKNSYLIIHKRIHTGEKPFQCNLCVKSFIKNSDLVKHQRTHTGERPFKCPLCQKSFSDSSGLIKHERIHTGERPFQCEICLKAFSESGSLIKHRRIHTGEKPFECDLCHRVFSQCNNLIRHKQRHAARMAKEAYNS